MLLPERRALSGRRSAPTDSASAREPCTRARRRLRVTELNGQSAVSVQSEGGLVCVQGGWLWGLSLLSNRSGEFQGKPSGVAVAGPRRWLTSATRRLSSLGTTE